MPMITPELKVQWSLQLQRRVMRLMLLHDEKLFRKKFSILYANSPLPELPLLKEYDRYLKLRALHDALIEHIVPDIRRQLSQHADLIRQREDAPTHGEIDWQRTIEQTLREVPGQTPLGFHTRLSQRNVVTPENILTVAILMAHRREIQETLHQDVNDEKLAEKERQFLIRAGRQIDEELSTQYALELMAEARRCNIPVTISQVERRRSGGRDPYRALIRWWQRLRNLRIGRQADAERVEALASKRGDAKAEAWLYEIWIVLEFVHLLDQEHAILASDTHVETEQLQFKFTWHGTNLMFTYNRERKDAAEWDNAPAARPDYTIERVQPCVVEYDGNEIWREPPIFLDAKYYIGEEEGLEARTHEPIKKLLGDMSLRYVNQGILFFPLLSDTDSDEHFPLPSIRPAESRHPGGWQIDHEIQRCELRPDMDQQRLRERLIAVLDYVVTHLPERPEPRCEGFWLDSRTVNASRTAVPINAILCPKRHISERVFDVVDAEKDCLKNPRLCHAIKQQIVRPQIVGVTIQEEHP